MLIVGERLGSHKKVIKAKDLVWTVILKQLMNDYKKIYQNGQILVGTLPSVFINISSLISVRCRLIYYRSSEILKGWILKSAKKHMSDLLSPTSIRCHLQHQHFSFAWLLARGCSSIHQCCQCEKTSCWLRNHLEIKNEYGNYC